MLTTACEAEVARHERRLRYQHQAVDLPARRGGFPAEKTARIVVIIDPTTAETPGRRETVPGGLAGG
jgi:hypothetical protein